MRERRLPSKADARKKQHLIVENLWHVCTREYIKRSLHFWQILAHINACRQQFLKHFGVVKDHTVRDNWRQAYIGYSWSDLTIIFIGILWKRSRSSWRRDDLEGSRVLSPPQTTFATPSDHNPPSDTWRHRFSSLESQCYRNLECKGCFCRGVR